MTFLECFFQEFNVIGLKIGIAVLLFNTESFSNRIFFILKNLRQNLTVFNIARRVQTPQNKKPRCEALKKYIIRLYSKIIYQTKFHGYSENK